MLSLLQRMRNAVGRNSPAKQILRRAAIKAPISLDDELKVTGGVLWLCRYSPLHARYPVEKLNCRIRPSLPLQQFHYYIDGYGSPLAFCNWAWLSAAVLDDVLATCRDLEANEFRCGDLPFFYEFLAPFGHAREVGRDLRSLPFFKGRSIPGIRGDRFENSPPAQRIKYYQF